MIKSKFADKYFIKQYIINDQEVSDWLNINWCELNKENAVIGYLFSVKESSGIQTEAQVLNVYLINRRYYSNKELTQKDITEDWNLFSILCKTKNNYKQKMVFKNPPINEWLNTKENWCKKLAHKLSIQFNMSFDEALSEVYYNISIFFDRKTIYMGNLTYIERAIINNIKSNFRNNKHIICLDNGNAISFETPLIQDGEDEPITLGDMIAASGDMDAKFEYETLKEKVINLLSKSFSKREIDQILKCKELKNAKGLSQFLDRRLYWKLLHWRMKHEPTEVTYEQV